MICVVIKKKDLAGALFIAVTADIWTSCQNLAYMAITVCFINEEWFQIRNQRKIVWFGIWLVMMMVLQQFDTNIDRLNKLNRIKISKQKYRLILSIHIIIEKNIDNSYRANQH